MKERLIEFLKKENKSAAQLAEEIGVQPSGISHILSGRNKPSLDFIIKMHEKYPYLSTEWLIFGKGEMYMDTAVKDLFADFTSESGINEINDHNKTSDSADTQVPATGNPEKKAVKDARSVEKIVWFFNDSTFREFYPDKEN